MAEQQCCDESRYYACDGLATNFVNVFKQAVMLFGPLNDVPDMFEELVIGNH